MQFQFFEKLACANEFQVELETIKLHSIQIIHYKINTTANGKMLYFKNLKMSTDHELKVQ